MVIEDSDRLDQLLDEHSSFLVVGIVPDRIEVEVGIPKECRSSFECVDESIRLPLDLDGLRVVGFERVDLVGECSFLLGEVVLGDLVVEKQLQEFVPLASQVGQRPGAPRLRRCSSSTPRLTSEVRTNRLDQLVIGPQEVDAQSSSAMETSSRSTRNAAALAAVSTPVDGLPASIGVDGSELAAHAAPDSARKEIGPAPSAGDVSPRCCLELGVRDEWVVLAGEPLVLDPHLSEVDAISEQVTCRRVLQPGDPSDVRV